MIKMRDDVRFFGGVVLFFCLVMTVVILFQTHERDKEYQESDFRPMNVTVLNRYNVTETWESEDGTFGGDYMVVEFFVLEDNSTKYYITGQNRWNDFQIGKSCTIAKKNLRGI